ncbi:unnamed protein product [Chrysoparadoxa australica]
MPPHGGLDDISGDGEVRLASAVLKSPSKTVHFIRHAQATHNLAADLEGRGAYEKEEHLDARLTDFGKGQCAELAKESKKLAGEVQLVVVSPLSRAVETALLCLEQVPGVPWIALDCLREKAGGHPCDKRRTRTEMSKEHPSIEWSFIADEQDDYWDALGKDDRETDEQIVGRCNDFFSWLAKRPENNIAVVTHSAFLSVLFNKAVTCGPPLSKWFENCEMRTTVLSLH